MGSLIYLPKKYRRTEFTDKWYVGGEGWWLGWDPEAFIALGVRYPKPRQHRMQEPLNPEWFAVGSEDLVDFYYLDAEREVVEAWAQSVGDRALARWEAAGASGPAPLTYTRAKGADHRTWYRSDMQAEPFRIYSDHRCAGCDKDLGSGRHQSRRTVRLPGGYEVPVCGDRSPSVTCSRKALLDARQCPGCGAFDVGLGQVCGGCKNRIEVGQRTMDAEAQAKVSRTRVRLGYGAPGARVTLPSELVKPLLTLFEDTRIPVNHYDNTADLTEQQQLVLESVAVVIEKVTKEEHRRGASLIQRLAAGEVTVADFNKITTGEK